MSKHELVIRKKTGLWRSLGRNTLLTLLWLFVFFVIITNISFIMHIYSDTLVSFYLLLNLNYNLYGLVIGGIVVIALVIWVYSAWRLRQLRGRQS
ncbi:hypothetical protein [Lactiplantibacillus fabifermentans]|uniref:Uncharacterized protein n=2 Tax=Lactiplantibacillus fabifermentans TaxID=483011 RepID=A0A0R2P0I0_9LACO|nr:hypothetical protein [Lactiplantibacillus fabifermentans]ETY73679.1 hypothetical protein LFAB_11355 [Lactiplantibacillus fabifermentans T30PCM01]KRO29171.1 hypothetical protein DY78_GL001337 [Lactiplantibacillus fabifermentans DSM 21115]